MDPARRAKLLILRGSRDVNNDELPTMVDLGVLGRPGVRTKTVSEGFGQQTEPFTARTSARMAA